jgi:hypothetical protein
MKGLGWNLYLIQILDFRWYEVEQIAIITASTAVPTVWGRWPICAPLIIPSCILRLTRIIQCHPPEPRPRKHAVPVGWWWRAHWKQLHMPTACFTASELWWNAQEDVEHQQYARREGIVTCGACGTEVCIQEALHISEGAWSGCMWHRYEHGRCIWYIESRHTVWVVMVVVDHHHIACHAPWPVMQRWRVTFLSIIFLFFSLSYLEISNLGL